jgi:Tfp pilus assembly protein PilV
MKQIFRPTSQQKPHAQSGIAFVIEMLIILFLVASCLAVLVNMFAYAHQKGVENSNTVTAIHLASNAAEEFAHNPAAVPSQQEVDGMYIYTTVTQDQQSTGVLYHATIEVYDAKGASQDGQPYYTIETARYMKAGGE